MPYIGQPPVTGDTTSSFRLLDNIASYTLTFDGSSAEVVSIANDTLSFNQHRFVTAQRVTYTHGGGTAIGGLTSGTAYFIIKVDQNTIKLATSAANANNNTAIDLTSLGVGVSHTLNVAFDGVNTKFKATYNDGTKAQLSRAGQLLLSINGVIQQPQETSSPTLGFGIDADSTIVFSVAPAVSDVVFGNIIANSIATFDISDNTVDNLTGTGSATSFTLSKTPANNQNILVTLDGVVQYPSDTSTTRAYSVTGSTLTFVSAPANGVQIQVRHIGFAGATSSAVTGFYGRTGNAVLTSADDINVQNITGVAATFTGNVSIAGTLTYEDVTNIDSVGLITARSGILVTGGGGINLSGGAGVVTATTYRVGTAATLDASGLSVSAGVVTATTYRVGAAATLDASGLSVSAGVVTTTTLRIGGGSAAAPSITPTGDSDTGIFFPSADTIAFGEGGSEAARIDSSGRFGIGISSPLVLVHGTTSVSSSTEYAGVAFFENSLNNVDTSPTTAFPVLKLTRAGKSGAAFRSSASFGIARYENPGTQARSRLDIALGHGDVAQPDTTVMSLLSSGNVGIGTTSFDAGDILHVSGAADTRLRVGTTSTSAGHNAAIRLDATTNGKFTIQTGADTSGGLRFFDNNASAERARIDSSGRLLVGTSTFFSGNVHRFYDASGDTTLLVTKDNSTSTVLVTAIHHAASTGNNAFTGFFTETAAISRGSIDYNRSAGQVRYNVTSDRRLKSEIQSAGTALDALASIQVRSYKWTETGYQVNHGFIAQELNEVAPDAVKVGDDGEEVTDAWAVDNGKLVPLLTKALQEAITKIETLEARLTAAGIE